MFTVASALCSLAPGLGWLIAFRVLQAAGQVHPGQSSRVAPAVLVRVRRRHRRARDHAAERARHEMARNQVRPGRRPRQREAAAVGPPVSRTSPPWTPPEPPEEEQEEELWLPRFLLDRRQDVE